MFVSKGKICLPSPRDTSSSRFADCPVCGKKVAALLCSVHLDTECGKETLKKELQKTRQHEKEAAAESTPKRLRPMVLKPPSPNIEISTGQDASFLSGQMLFHEFITEEEESTLLAAIDECLLAIDSLVSL